MQTFVQMLEQMKQQDQAVAYISSPDCGVCNVIKPKVKALAEQLAIPLFEFNVREYPQLASEFEVLTVPAVILFAKGKEYHRQARFIQMGELEKALNNPAQAVDYAEISAN